MNIFSKLFGDPNAKEVAKIQLIVERINELEPVLEVLSDEDLKNKTTEFKERLAAGASLDDILPEAFATVREASKRTIGLRHFDVQLIGGVVLHRGQIAEMKTGEGKTLVATLPIYLNALAGEGCHSITVNDYLARRDCGWMGPVFNMLGISCAVIVHETAFIYDANYTGTEDDPRLVNLRPVSRKEGYEADITYGTNNEFGFDYLRDNMAPTREKMVQRKLNYAIIDEVDSVLVDEARTPLIISAPAEESAKMYQQFARIVPRLQENSDYNIDEKMRAVALTDDGIRHIEKILGLGNIYTEGGIQLVHHLEQALRANTLFKNDRDYIVKNGEVIIIDEFTGRLMHGRRYSEGLHQAIEAKENVDVKKESLTLATVTLQNYFRLYKKLSGMTGTALTESEEFHKIYKLEVVAIPTNSKLARRDLPDRVFATELGKFKAVAQRVKELRAVGQPVLIGTISIEKNELLSRLLESAGVPHQVLNAKNHEREAQIIAEAGKLGAVTLATNMAGRGVDIILGGDPRNAGDDAAAKDLWREEHDKVVALGGLFILGTERHEARRIDNQLRGRSGRQGDPGFSQFYVSLDDDLMRIFGSDRIKNMMQSWGVPEDTPIENRFVSRAIESAQHRVEGYNFDIRKHLVDYDDVLNKQREAIYKRRREILAASENEPEKLKTMILEMISDELNQIVSFHTASEDQTIWNLKEIAEVANAIFNVDAKKLEEDLHSAEKLAGDKQQDAFARTEIINYLEKLAEAQYVLLEQSIEQYGADQMRKVESELLIRAIDNLWVEHLSAVDMLRTGIGLRGYGQRDPLVEYKREAYDMYVQLLNLINKQVVYTIYKVGPGMSLAKSVIENSQARESGSNGPVQFGGAQQTTTGSQQKAVAHEKIGRNDPCPCGSGKKYKKCCGIDA